MSLPDERHAGALLLPATTLDADGRGLLLRGPALVLLQLYSCTGVHQTKAAAADFTPLDLVPGNWKAKFSAPMVLSLLRGLL